MTSTPHYEAHTSALFILMYTLKLYPPPTAPWFHVQRSCLPFCRGSQIPPVLSEGKSVEFKWWVLFHAVSIQSLGWFAIRQVKHVPATTFWKLRGFFFFLVTQSPENLVPNFPHGHLWSSPGDSEGSKETRIWEEQDITPKSHPHLPPCSQWLSLGDEADLGWWAVLVFSQGCGTLSAENPVAHRKQQEGKTQGFLSPTPFTHSCHCSFSCKGPPNFSWL